MGVAVVAVVKGTRAIVVVVASKRPPVAYAAPSPTASCRGALVPPTVGSIGGHEWFLCRSGLGA